MQKKVCILGAPSSGKTRLLASFSGTSYEDWNAASGVAVARAQVSRPSADISLILWDVHGEEQFMRIRRAFLRGCAGYVLVVDGTRPETLDRALELPSLVQETAGDKPFVAVFNKADVKGDWAVPQDAPTLLATSGWTVVEASAKTGDGVVAAFQALTEKILPKE